MPTNKGKQFEQVIRKSFEAVDNVSIDRIPDQVTKYKGSSSNICDFIVYKYPYQYYIECKSVRGSTLPFSNIRENQWNGLLEKSEISGVIAGIICWWIDRDETWFIPIWIFEDAKRMNAKSINLNSPYMQGYWTPITGKKKRTYYDYDMSEFLRSIENE